MKRFGIKIRVASLALVLVFSYLMVYYTLENVDVYIPTSAAVQDEFIIILDAGHGGMDGGCSSPDGILEKDVNLSILLSVRDLCKVLGYNVEATRETDISIHDKGIEGPGPQKRSDMENRLALFNKYSNALCISIHQNKFTQPSAWGAQMFYSDTNPANEGIARIMQSKFVEYLQPDNTREIKLSSKELYLCYFCDNPTVMVECGFLSNPEESAKLRTADYQKQVAFTIFSGINEYVKQNIT